MMEYLTDDCKNDESFVSLADVFETWINGRTNQNTEQLEKEEFTAGLIMKRSETLLNEDSRRRSFDRIRQMKLYELGQERVKKFRISRNRAQPSVRYIFVHDNNFLKTPKGTNCYRSR